MRSCTYPATASMPPAPHLRELRPELRVMSAGDTIEIYKEVGLPSDVAARFDVRQMSGTHGIGHTRMATESAVTTMGAHPFSTGPDQCLVHNGSLSNHNSLRRELRREGIHIETENDTEVGAAYLTWKMQQGSTLAKHWTAALKILMAFLPLSSEPKTALVLCATRLPVNPPSWPKPINMSPLARNTAPWSTCPASIRPAFGNPSPQLFISGITDMQTFDLEQNDLRTIERHASCAKNRYQPNRLEYHNPRASHAIAVGLDARLRSPSMARRAIIALA